MMRCIFIPRTFQASLWSMNRSQTLTYYAIWSRVMLIALRAKNKLTFIDESSKRNSISGYWISGYKVQDLTFHRIFVSRDVHFHEHIFPCKSLPLSSPLFPAEQIQSPEIPSLTPITPIVPSASIFSPTRRFCRVSKPPICSRDYVCSTLSHFSPHLIVNYISYSNLSAPIKFFNFSFCHQRTS